MATTLWQIELLGGLRLCCGNRSETRFRTQKTAAFFAYLALFPNRTHPREELAVRFWEDAADNDGRASLRVAQHSLRKQLETPDNAAGSLLIADRVTIGLRREAFGTDVARFEDALAQAARTKRTDPQNHAARLAHLTEATAIYTAPLLPGFYDDWVLEERERLHSRFLTALEEAEALHRKLGQTREADAVALRRERSEGSDHVSAGEGASVAVPVATPPAPTPKAAFADNLPHFFTRFWGRERERAQVIAHLSDPDVSVITLLGPGGIGKTRLSVEAARAWGRATVWVPVASVVRGEELSDVLRESLHLPQGSGTADDFETVAAHLRELAATDALPLLLFDNFEQVEETSGARFVSRLLRAVPQVRLLVSSRRRLGVPGECFAAVETLPLPGESTDPATLLLNPSAALFADRARSVTPDFAVTERNAPSVAALVRLLDGLPLAIELAAAWVSVLTPAQMVTKLSAQGERFALLASRKAADRVERHRSLWNTIGWSYDLLTPDLQALWRRLSVFHGGFTSGMAETVAGDFFTFDGLARLRERSLIRLMAESDGDDPDEPRYELLESLREFGIERVEDEEADAVQQQLRLKQWQFLQGLADECESDGSSARTFSYIQRFKRELLNIRVVLNYAEAGTLPVENGLRLAAGLSRLWKRGGYLREGEGFLSALLKRAESMNEVLQTATKARALHCLADIQRLRAEDVASENSFRSALALYRSIGDDVGTMRTLADFAELQQGRKQDEEAEAMIQESFDLSLKLDNKEYQAASLHALGFIANGNEDYVSALRCHEQELALRLELGEELGIVLAYGGLAVASRHLKNFAASEQYLADVFRSLFKMQDKVRLIVAFHHYGELMLETSDGERSAFSFGVAAALRDEIGFAFSPAVQAVVEEKHCLSRQKCGEKSFRETFLQGQNAPLASAVAFVLRETGSVAGTIGA